MQGATGAFARSNDRNDTAVTVGEVSKLVLLLLLLLILLLLLLLLLLIDDLRCSERRENAATGRERR